MNDNPLISIVIPVYNGLGYLPECLASVEAQDYCNIELILVDDGSTDGSSLFLDEYANSRPWVHVIHQNNQGVSHARNVGIKIAAGEFLAFHDSDDMMEPFMLSSLLHALQSKPEADLAAGAIRFCKGDETEDVLVLSDGRRDLTLPRHESLRYIQNLAAWGKLYRMNLIKAHDLHFNENMSNGEDQDFVIRYLIFSRDTVFVHNTLMSYTVHRGSSNNKFEMGLLPKEIYISHFSFWTRIAKDMPPYWSVRDRKLFGEVLIRRQIAMWVWINATLKRNAPPARRGLLVSFLHYLLTTSIYVPAPAAVRAIAGTFRRYGFKDLI